MHDTLDRCCGACHLDPDATRAWARRTYAGQAEEALEALDHFAIWMEAHLPGYAPEPADIGEWCHDMASAGESEGMIVARARVAEAWVEWLLSGDRAAQDGSPSLDDIPSGVSRPSPIERYTDFLAAVDEPDPQTDDGPSPMTPSADSLPEADRDARERDRAMDEAVAFLCSGSPDVNAVVTEWLDSTDASDPMGVMTSLAAFVEWMDRHGGPDGARVADIDSWLYSISEYVSGATARAHGNNVRAFVAWRAGVPGAAASPASLGPRRAGGVLNEGIRRSFAVDEATIDTWQRETASTDRARETLMACLDGMAHWAARNHMHRLLTVADADRWRVSLVGITPALAADARFRRVVGFLTWLDGHTGSEGPGDAAGTRVPSSEGRDLSPIRAAFGVSPSCVDHWLVEQRLGGSQLYGVESLLAFSTWVRDRETRRGDPGSQDAPASRRVLREADVEDWLDSVPREKRAGLRDAVTNFMEWLRLQGYHGEDATFDAAAGPAGDTASEGGARDGGRFDSTDYEQTVVADVAAREALARNARNDEKVCRVFAIPRDSLESFRSDVINLSVLRQHVLAFVDWFDVFHPGATPQPVHIDRWYEALRKRLSPPTSKEYRASVCTFARWLRDRGLFAYDLPDEGEEPGRGTPGGTAVILEAFGITAADLEEWRLDAWKQTGRAPGMTAVISFSRWLKEFRPQRPPREMPDGNDLQGWVDHLDDGGGEDSGDGRKRMARSTISTYRYSVRGFLRWFLERGILRAPATPAVGIPPQPPAPPILPSSETRAARSRMALSILAEVFHVSEESITSWQTRKGGTGRKLSLSPMKKFAAWWSVGSTRSGLPSQDDITTWGNALMAAEHISRQTATVYVSQVRSFLRWLEPERAGTLEEARALAVTATEPAEAVDEDEELSELSDESDGIMPLDNE